MYEFSSGNMGRVLPEYLSKWTTNKVKAGNQFQNAICEINDTRFGSFGTNAKEHMNHELYVICWAVSIIITDVVCAKKVHMIHAFVATKWHRDVRMMVMFVLCFLCLLCLCSSVIKSIVFFCIIPNVLGSTRTNFSI